MLSFGQLFGSNFWSSFKSAPSESIENLLKQDNCKIEDLLDDNDLLQECKNSNKNLINYLNREKVKQLVDFITVMPEEDEHNRGHKYPFLSSEVFNCDIPEILDMFFIAPCDDKKPELEEPAEEDEDATKFDSNYEKDNDYSDPDSDEDDSNEGEYSEDSKDKAAKTEKSNEKASDEDMKVEEIDDSKETTQEDQEKPQEENSEKKDTETEEESSKTVENEPVELDVEDTTKTQSLETPEETSKTEDVTEEKPDEKAEEVSPQTEASTPPKEPESESATTSPEETKQEVDENTTPAASSDPVENTKSDVVESTKSEEPESEAQPAPATKQAFTEQTPESTEESDQQTITSETATEETAETQPKEELSTNKYDLMDYLNQFIDTEEDLNDVLAGYYSRLCNILMQRKLDEFGKYFYENEEFMYKLAYHSYSKSITDIIVKILDISAEKIEKEQSEVNRIKTEFFKRLLQRLSGDSENEQEYSLNIFQIFNELSYRKIHYELLVDESVLNTLGEILHNGSPESSSNAAVRILNILISNLRDNVTEKSEKQKQSFRWAGAGEDEDDVLIQEEGEDKTEEAQKAEEIINNHPLV